MDTITKSLFISNQQLAVGLLIAILDKLMMVTILSIIVGFTLISFLHTPPTCILIERHVCKLQKAKRAEQMELKKF